MRGTLADITRRIQEDQELSSRAVIALVVIGPSTRVTPAEVEEHLTRRLSGPVQVVLVGTQPNDRERLRALNTDRSALLHAFSALVFLCSSGETTRTLRQEAPDLTAALAFSAELDDATVLQAAELQRRIHQVQVQRHATIDLSGLVPHTTEVVRMPIDRVYLERQLTTGSGPSTEEQMTLLLAEPGAGKTLWMKHRALAASETVSLYVALAGWAAQARERSVSLRDFVQAEIGRLLDLPPVDLTSFPAVELLLDGLDEVPSLGDRRRIVDEALALRAQHPGVQVILSARAHVIDDLLSETLRKVGQRRLDALTREQAEELVERLLRTRREPTNEAELSREVAALRDAIVQHPDFERFVGNPLLLTFVTVLAELGRSMPTQRVELYSDLLEMLIVSWRRVRSSGTGHRLNRADVLRVVAPLGWWLVERGVGGLRESELLDFLVDLDTREGEATSAREAARHRLEQLREDSALLHASDGLWRFHHATIAEYLGARAALISDRLRQVLAKDPYEPRRVQVLAFTLAIACDVDPRDEVALPLLNALDRQASRPGRYDARIPRTLVACLTEALSMPALTRKALAAHVLRIALRQKLREDRRMEAILAVRDLCRLHDRPIQAALEELVADEQGVDVEALAAPRNSLFAFRLPLPVLIQGAGVDATPLIQRWIRSPNPRVRAVAWAAWAQRGAWEAIVGKLDPAAADLVDPLYPKDFHNPFPPPSWTEALRAQFPTLALDSPPVGTTPGTAATLPAPGPTPTG